jgi:Ca2+-binding RTX toxin-like protein
MLNVASLNVNSTPHNLLMAAGGKTVVYGRGMNDTIQQGSLTKQAEFYGGDGDDYLSGNSGNDLLVGGLGLDRLIGNAGNNELWGDNVGQQDLDIGDADNISASTGMDKIYGGGGNDSISAGSANDYVFGGWGADTIDGGAGNDRLYGGQGNDTITGFSGNDLLAGNEGDDRLYGQTGLDVLIGGDNADYMTGDSDNDLLFDGTLSSDGPSSLPGTDASTFAGDANDLAMADLLADWTADSLINLSLLNSMHDLFIDSLSGGLGNDTASKGAGDTSDAENMI